MAVLHSATLTPTKAEAIAAWLPRQPWAGTVEGALELIGAFRLDDPDGAVGVEIHLVRAGDTVFQVPLTYREAPLGDATDHLVCRMAHSALGERWIYDGLADPVCTSLLAAATLTGTGQALAFVELDGRRVVVPPQVVVRGGGGVDGPVAIDGFVTTGSEEHWEVVTNDRFELRVSRRPVADVLPDLALTATWPGQTEPVVLAEIRVR